MPALVTPAPAIRGYDVICFSSIDWDFIWQGHQEIMSTLAANGNRVLFVENTGVRTPAVRDLPRLGHRVRNWWRGTKGFRGERDNLFVYSPLLLPFPYSPLVRRINRALLLRALRLWMGSTGFGQPIVWSFLPTPLIRETIQQLDPIASVYYCVDDFAASSPGARRIVQSEQRMFSDVDLVFVTSEQLRRKAARWSTNVHLFPFGVSFKKFERIRLAQDPIPADLAALPRPIVGYVGGIHQWVDLELLGAAARAMPEASFAMIGPVQVEAAMLPTAPNLHFFGTRSHDDVPRYIKGFDVGVVPYRLSDYTANVYPTKLNEYLALGIPVVATDLPEIRRFNTDHGPHVDVGLTPGAFVDALRRVVREPSDRARAARIEVARENSWESRLDKMSALVEKAIAVKRGRRDKWETTLRRAYRRARGRVVGGAAAVVITYVLLFETALPWTAARPLRVAAAPQRADAVVVFAGGVGESGQAGGGYQERVKMAVDLYRAGWAPQMVLVSGYAFAFKEAEIMRDLAVALGVPPTAIVLETTAATTYENVVRTNAILQQRGWTRILLVSSPYHMRRALAVWRKQAPAVEVIPTPVTDSQFYMHGRGASLQQLRGLVQEYAAIAYYRAQGWL